MDYSAAQMQSCSSQTSRRGGGEVVYKQHPCHTLAVKNKEKKIKKNALWKHAELSLDGMDMYRIMKRALTLSICDLTLQ